MFHGSIFFERNLASPQTIHSALKGIVLVPKVESYPNQYLILHLLVARTNYIYHLGGSRCTSHVLVKSSPRCFRRQVHSTFPLGNGFLQFTKNMFEVKNSVSMENRAYPYQHTLMEHPFVTPLYSVYRGHDIQIVQYMSMSMYTCITFPNKTSPISSLRRYMCPPSLHQNE